MKPRLLLGTMLCLAAVHRCRADTNMALPRYHFTTGEELTYQGHDEFKYQTGAFDTAETAKIWVLGQNGDGSWRLLEWSEASTHRTDDKSNYTAPDEKRISWTRADVFQNGYTDHLESTETQSSTVEGIIPLPKDAEELKSGWKWTNVKARLQCEYHLASTDTGGGLVIHEVMTGDQDAIYLSSHAEDITMDPKRGVITQIESVSTQGYGFVGKSTGHDALIGAKEIEPAVLSRMDDDFTVYQAVQKTERALLAREDITPQEVDAAGEEATKSLKDARAKITTPGMQELIDTEIEQLPPYVSYEKKAAQRRQDMLSEPALDWKTTDLAGNPHSLADYRGKVVVLDFWYRGCGWCMAAMPQVKQVAEHYAGKQVVVLGMTTDRPESKDADYVVKKMGLTYPTLYAKEIADQYKIEGFPTMLILDQTGAIKDIHAGYSPTLRDDVEKKIDALLKPAKAM